MPKKDYNNTIKAYAKKYNISTIEKDKLKSVGKLSNEIYSYEKQNRPNNPMYPFLNLKFHFKK
jgi:hypothetical protein